MSENRINDELAAIEAALGNLTPAASGVGRDRLMFLAGRASASRASAFGVRRLAAAFRRNGVNTVESRRTEKAAASRRAPNLLWPIATAASLLVALTFGLLWAAGNNSRSVEQTAAVAVASLPTTVDLPADTSPPSPWENRRLCQLVLEKGIDALPQSSYSSGASSGTRPVPHEETYRSLLKQFLDNPTS